MRKIILCLLLIFLAISILPAVKAQIVISSVSTNPSAIKPGATMDISITLENTASDKIEDISIQLNLKDLPFVPVESSSEKVVERIYGKDTSTVVFKIMALPEASAKFYKIPVIIMQNQSSRESVISVEVYGDVKLDADISNKQLVKVGDKGDVTIRFINKGEATIDFLTITLQDSASYEIISSKSSYIGKIEPGDYETATFEIYAKEKNPNLVIKLEYKDQNNKQYSEEKSLPLTIYTAEEAKSLGLIKPSYTFYFIIVILLVLIIIIIRRIIRAKNKKHRLHHSAASTPAQPTL